MIDSHCHLDVVAFDADRVGVLARAASVGITDLIVPAVDPPSWPKIRALASHAAPRCHATIGLHPVALPSLPAGGDDALLAALERAAAAGGIVAIGECGLDTSIDLTLAPLERQRRLLGAQFTVARRLDLPVILHARGPGCYALLLEYLRQELLPARGGVIHSYGGGADLLREFLRFDLMFGFAGPVTYANARKVRASAMAVPDDRLLAETDAPDQTPEPHRPGRCEPAHLADVVASLALARRTTSDEIARLTSTNARRLFRL